MKKILYFFLGSLILFLSSCAKDFLETEPLTSKTDGNYYKTPQEAQDALTGCYDALQLIYSDGVAFPLASEVMGDECFGGTGYGDSDDYAMLDEFDVSVNSGSQNIYEKNWANYYKGIFRVNSLLTHLDGVEWGSQTALRGTIESEARFLRAYFYFDMVRLWERVPLLTAPTSDNVPQASADETYALIASDLLFAIKNGRTETYSQIATTEYGHANKWAAESLLARVFLFYTGYYGKSDLVGLVSKDEALAYLEDVIANSGHDLVSNYADLWPAASTYEAAQNGLPITTTTYAGETNKEVVFSIKYTYTSDYNGNTDGNHWLVMNGLRKMAWKNSGYGSGWGACTVIPSFYKTWSSTDKRKASSIMAIKEEGVNFTQIKDMKEYTGYFTKKYIPLCDENGNSTAEMLGGVSFMISQYQDFFVLRYADVLLMAAELGSPNALGYVNQVRTRAGLEAAPSVDKDVIYQERKYEFAFEGIRYWDLLRYDNSLQYASDKLSLSEKVLTGGIEDQKVIQGTIFKTTRGLSQIPGNQITLSGGVLTQNPGW
ncbi:MAG: RagB/SusD family nutrient uptake outer membrane protein [Sphingobacteriia bacterium]|nr:RagB/SusD family nutrient uptake outer membrane protein [Sphingobacteriia bacterium]